MPKLQAGVYIFRLYYNIIWYYVILYYIHIHIHTYSCGVVLHLQTRRLMIILCLGICWGICKHPLHWQVATCVIHSMFDGQSVSAAMRGHGRSCGDWKYNRFWGITQSIQFESWGSRVGPPRHTLRYQQLPMIMRESSLHWQYSTRLLLHKMFDGLRLGQIMRRLKHLAPPPITYYSKIGRPTTDQLRYQWWAHCSLVCRIASANAAKFGISSHDAEVAGRYIHIYIIQI